MKRTRQRFDRPQMDVPAFTSGLSQFEGEDLLYHDRVSFQSQQQRSWVQQQISEHEAHKERLRQEENDYAQQTNAITRMRGMLEDDSTTSKQAQLKALQQTNLRLA